MVWFGTVVSIILIIFSLSFSYFLNQSINANIETKLYHEAMDILVHFRTNDTSNLVLANNSDILIMKNQKILYKSKTFSLKNIEEYFKNKNIFYIFEDSKDDETVNAIYILKDEGFSVFIYKKNIDNKIENFEDPLLVLDPILLLVLIFVASKLIDKILYPIKKITKAARDISINNFTNTIEIPKNNDEIKALVLSFNEMIKRLQKGVDDLDRFNADVSHELRTPLTAIKGEAEVILRKPRQAHEYVKSLKTIFYETNNIEQIVENLLLLTKYSKENIRQTFEICHLDAIVLNTIAKYDKDIKNKHINLYIQKLEPITIKSNSLLLYTIFSNLIDNAIKYTPNNKKIILSLYNSDKIHFIVEDEGIGIAKKDLSKITERFYRVDSSRNKRIRGFGLGLSLVKNSVELLDGELTLSSIINRGTMVQIIL